MSLWEVIGDILFVLAFVLLNGFFVAAEFAIVKIRATQLEPMVKRGNLRARIATDIVAHLDAYLSATQLGITMTSLALGWLGEPGRGRALGVGEVKLTNMVTPAIKKVTYEVDIKRLILRKLKLAVADGLLKADGETIYTATDLKVGLFQPA